MRALTRLGPVVALLVACAGEPVSGPAAEAPLARSAAVEPLAVPAPPGARAPELTADGDGVLLSWLRPDADGHVLEMARLGPRGWSEVREVVRSSDLFVNWADRPGVVRAPDGALVAWWLGKLGAGTYAYGIHLARSEDDGATWRDLGLLHPDDRSETEHGFVAWTRRPSELRAYWLDGRAMAGGGDMELRTAGVGADGAGPSRVIDGRVCECCALAAAAGDDDRDAVAYRDRSEAEVRDIAWVSAGPEGSSEPRPVASDGWTIHGCPVNGPAVVAGRAGAGPLVAWFTAAGDVARVRATVPGPDGEGGGAPFDLDTDDPPGRVDAARGSDGRLWVSWLAAAGTGEGGEVVVREVSPEGPLGDRIVLGSTSRRRVAGVPRLEPLGDGLLAVWMEDPGGEEPTTLRATRLAPGS